MKRLLIPALIFLLAGCSQQAAVKRSANRQAILTASPLAPGVQETPPKHLPTVEEQRLAHVRKAFAFYPQARYPIRSHVQSQNAHGLQRAEKDTDTLLFGTSLVFVLGTVKDTSQYFGIFYYEPADDVILKFAAIDKQGRIIGRTFIGDGCWQGAESDCRTYVQVTSDLKIEVNHSEYLYPYEDVDDLSTYGDVPNEASGYRRVSQIGKDGRIRELERTEKTQAELLKNPIIHD